MTDATDSVPEVRHRGFRPYPKYTESGVEWLGEIPEHWESKAVKRQFRVVNGSTPKSGAAENWDGDIPWVTPDDLGKMNDRVINEPSRHLTRKGYESCGTQMVRAGSLVLSTRAPIGHLGIAGTAVCTNQGCRSLVFRRLGDERYFYFQLHAARPVLEAAGRGSTFKELGSEDLQSTELAVPPLYEQRVIADFLDGETAKIDALLAKKERLIELLQEKRTALVTRAVTRGLDPNVPMKDSGVQWLDKIPAQWQLGPLKRISPEITVGVVVNPSTYVQTEGVPFLYGSDIREGRAVAATARRMSDEDSKSLSKSRLSAGDLVCVRVGAPGVTAVISPELEGANCASVLIVRHASTFDSQWLCYAMNSRIVRHQVELVQYGAAQEQFNVAHAVEFVVPLAPASEQREIAAFLDLRTTKLDALVTKIREAVDHLKEFRTTLISAAVTGKIDVRDAPDQATTQGGAL